MNKYLQIDPWKIIENGLNDKNNLVSESIMSLGNGYMGMRGNFEENYTGETFQGTYIGGVYYPDKTKVGWWKNGYPEYFAKVLNSTNFLGIDITIDGITIDLNKNKPINFKRVLNMKEGTLTRSFDLSINNKDFSFNIIRFLSMHHKEIGAIKYVINSSTKSNIKVTSYVDGGIMNYDSNYDEYFWNEIDLTNSNDHSLVTLATKKTDFYVTTGASTNLYHNNTLETEHNISTNKKCLKKEFEVTVEDNSTLEVVKYITVTTNRDYDEKKIITKAIKNLSDAKNTGFDQLLDNHIKSWDSIWESSDIKIEGDDEAQQGVRFNIFQLKQTYTGDDPRLNIGPKGFTGEKYGGSTYWDTEAYCLPFYLSTTNQEVSKNLLVYRHNHLEKAIENAAKLDLKGALYPMVTMNGEECHNEWEITFEEIHRNGAIAYAIYNYINYTGDSDYLLPKGMDVLIEISKFWASRVNFNPRKDAYMILGVTGPNEYDNNVNNNWYTNKIAAWTLQYTLECIEALKVSNSKEIADIINKHSLTEDSFDKWADIVEKMYYPYDDELDIIMQQDGFMDKEQILVKDLDASNLPLCQNWSWDKILRSNFIKQADVLQGLFLFNDEFDIDMKKKCFDFYEPRTVHESSLSPCIYSIIAAELKYYDKAYELGLRTARLDLDNYNNDTEDGLHITSMAGTWMSIVYGFGGFKVKDSTIHLTPFIPEKWDSYSYKILFREHLYSIKTTQNHLIIDQIKGSQSELYVNGEKYNIEPNTQVKISL